MHSITRKPLSKNNGEQEESVTVTSESRHHPTSEQTYGHRWGIMHPVVNHAITYEVVWTNSIWKPHNRRMTHPR